MAIKRPKPEKIVVKVRQVEVPVGQAMPRIDAIKQTGVTEQTYYRWSAGGQESVLWTVFPPNKYGGVGT